MPNPNLGAFGWMKSQKERVEAVNNQEKIEEIPVELIDLNDDNSTYNSKDTTNDIKDLAESIRRIGLQNAIVVKKKDDGRYCILAGERRFRAIKDVLNRRSIEAIVKNIKSPLEEELIKNETNLYARKLTTQQQFDGFRNVLKALEADGTDTSTLSVAEKAEATQLTKKQIKKFESILNNASDAINDYDSNEISFSSLKSIAEEKERLNARQRRINDAIEIFAKSREDVSSIVYADDNNIIYYVTEGKDDKFVVKMRNITTNIPGIESKASDLPPSESREVMQTFLDSYAEANGLRIISEEEVVSYAKDTQQPESYYSDRKEEAKMDVPPISINNEMTPEDIKNTTVTKTERDEEKTVDNTDSETINDSNDSEPENNIEKDTNKESNLNDKTVKESSKEERKELKGQLNLIEEDEFSKINPVDYICVGESVETGKTIKGALVTNGQGYYLVKGKVNIGKALSNSDVTHYNTHCITVEVKPETIRVIKKQ